MEVITIIGLLFLFLYHLFSSLHFDPATIGDRHRPINGYVFNFFGNWRRYVDDAVVAEGTGADWANFPSSAPFLILVGGILVFLSSFFLYGNNRLRTIILAFVRIIVAVIGLTGMLQYVEFGLELSSTINYFRFSFGFFAGMIVFLSAMLLSIAMCTIPKFFVVNYPLFKDVKPELIRNSYLYYNISNPPSLSSPKQEKDLELSDDSYSSLFIQGRMFFEQSSFLAAIATFEEMIQRGVTGEQLVAACYFIAQASSMLERHQEALEFAEKGLSHSKEIQSKTYHSLLLAIIGKSRYFLGDTAEYVEKIRRVIGSRKKMLLGSLKFATQLPNDILIEIITKVMGLTIKGEYVIVED